MSADEEELLRRFVVDRPSCEHMNSVISFVRRNEDTLRRILVSCGTSISEWNRNHHARQQQVVELNKRKTA
jgi:hypothetical protein